MVEQSVFKIEGHRGYGLFEIENSIPSYRRCVSEGLDSIELDVFLTKDQQILVLHGDGSENHFGEIKINGQYHYIGDLDSSVIIDQYVLSEEHKDVKVPTLEQVLKEFGGKIRINIELKGLWKWKWVQPNLVNKVIDIVYDLNLQKEVIFSSFNHQYFFTMMEYVEQRNLEPIPFNFIFAHLKDENNPNEKMDLFNGIDLDLPVFQKLQKQINGVTGGCRLLKKESPQYLEYFRKAQQKGFSINVYFRADEEETKGKYDLLKQQKFDYIITNQPQFALNYKNTGNI